MRAAAGVQERQETRAFPWDAVTHAGLCLLRLSPPIFWAMTPLEFFAMTGGLKPPSNALNRAGMEALMRRFPDDAC